MMTKFRMVLSLLAPVLAVAALQTVSVGALAVTADSTTANQAVVSVDVATLHSYVGNYKVGANAILNVSNEGNRVFVQLTGQRQLEIFAKSNSQFFAKDVDAQFAFQTSAKGVTTGLVLQQGGQTISAHRVSDIEAEQLRVDLATRLQNQTANPIGESLLRQHLTALQNGTPNYGLMETGLATATRQQLPKIQSKLAQLGAFESMTFRGVGPGGMDIYEVQFANGSAEWRVAVSANGKLAGAASKVITVARAQ